jgi:hypothetical protein
LGSFRNFLTDSVATSHFAPRAFEPGWIVRSTSRAAGGGTAFTFERVLREVKAKYVLGLTATPTRKNGHHPIISMQCGPIRFHLSPKKAVQSSPLEHKVIPRLTARMYKKRLAGYSALGYVVAKSFAD